jgi:hypothetical protein
MALSADSRPYFTTIAVFVSNLEHEITSLFGDVLLYASELGLIGKEHLAIDGCKLPSNASKKWSGTHKELEEKCKKLVRVAERIVERHRERDEHEGKSASSCSEPEKAQRYRRTKPKTRPPKLCMDSSTGPAATSETYPQATATRMPARASFNDPLAVSNRRRELPAELPSPSAKFKATLLMARRSCDARSRSLR